MNKAFRAVVASAGLVLAGTVQAGLPIGAEQARARGVELPLPFGISLFHMDQEQPLKVNRLEVQAGGSNVPATIENLENEDESDNLRFDAWLFPFLDVYALVGKVDSSSKGTAVVPAGAFGPQEQRIAFQQDYDGDTLGLGMTLAYGHKNLFATLDINYTETDINISSEDATALVINPRVGWAGTQGGFKGAAWLGVMHQDLEQTLEVDTQFGGIPVTATVEEEAEEPLNYIVGGRWQIDRHWHATLELGFGEREHWMANFGYRF